MELRHTVRLTAFAGCAALIAACTGGADAATTTAIATTAITTTTTTSATSTSTSTTSTSTTTLPETTTTAVPPVPPPANLAHVVKNPPDLDGKWQVIAKLSGAPVIWTTHFRPMKTKPDKIAAFAVVEQSKLHAALFNGPTMPGAGKWKNGNRVGKAALPSLVAAFNGGFELRHMFKGGYKTEGVTVAPLQKGHATIAIKADGTVAVGEYGVDFTDDGTWLSFRQNLPPVVLKGKNNTNTHSQNVWGTNYGSVLITNRSAVCTRIDGRLMFAYVPNVNVVDLANVLVGVGCSFAMQLDINGTWPQFCTYTKFGTTDRRGVAIDSRMTNPNRYVTKSAKDFIAFFDPSTLRAGALAG